MQVFDALLFIGYLGFVIFVFERMIAQHRAMYSHQTRWDRVNENLRSNDPERIKRAKQEFFQLLNDGSPKL